LINPQLSVADGEVEPLLEPLLRPGRSVVPGPAVPVNPPTSRSSMIWGPAGIATG
jgi:hypothetical protein